MPSAEKDEKASVLFSELVATRICHDLAGPIGALNNGVELFADEGGGEEMASQAVDLLRMSAQEGRAKLQLFRMAYGVASADSKADAAEMKEILASYFGYSKIKLAWNISGDAAFFTAAARRMLANMVLVASSALLMGGTLQISLSAQGGGAVIEVFGQGTKIKQDEDVKAILANQPGVQPTSKLVPALLLSQYVAAAGGKLVCQTTDNSFRLNLSL